VLPILVRSIKRVRDEHGLKKTKRFVTSMVQYLPHSAHWLSYVHDLYGHHLDTEPVIDMVRSKFQRPYHSKRLSPAKRLTMLRAHYGALETCFRTDIVRALLAGKPLGLGDLHGKSSEAYELVLQRHERFRHEGELTLFLVESRSGTMLSALTFNLLLSAHHDVQIRIAGLQGPACDDAKALIVKATRDLWGARPKALVLDAVYALAEIFHCRDIQAVQARNHPLNDINHLMVADNDGFWEELAVARTGQGDFVLPAMLPARTLEEVPAKKRKEWLAKQALRRQLRSETIGTVASWIRFGSYPNWQQDQGDGLDVAAE